jgi:hypothetical protein
MCTESYVGGEEEVEEDEDDGGGFERMNCLTIFGRANSLTLL